MEGKETEVSGGGTTTSIADLPADWRRTMNDELRDALKALDAENTIDRDDGEFTASEAVGIWAKTPSGTRKKLRRLYVAGKVTVREVYDPEVKRMVNAYKMV